MHTDWWITIGIVSVALGVIGAGRMWRGVTRKPIQAIYSKGRFDAPRKPQPEPTPEDNYGAWMTAIYLGIAAMLIVFAVAILAHR